MYFSFDGENFDIHNTEGDAKEWAEQAMHDWQVDAAEGWDELSTQVCYGKVTHAVKVERVEVTDDNRHLVTEGCDGLENHILARVKESPGPTAEEMPQALADISGREVVLLDYGNGVEWSFSDELPEEDRECDYIVERYWPAPDNEPKTEST